MQRRAKSTSAQRETRDEIPTSAIIARLSGFVNGDCEMTAPQVSAALGLLKKTLPDLPQAQNDHTVKRAATDYSRDELVTILNHAGYGGTGTADEG